MTDQRIEITCNCGRVFKTAFGGTECLECSLRRTINRLPASEDDLRRDYEEMLQAEILRQTTLGKG